MTQYPQEIREIINDYLVDNHKPQMDRCTKDIKSAFLFLRIRCRRNHSTTPPKIGVYSQGIKCSICHERVRLDKCDIIREITYF